MLRHLCLLFLAHLFVSLLYGQNHYNFIHYPPESGIISNQVNTTVQDDKGYLWLGTTNGLQRFDGIRFKTFRHNEKNASSIPINPVWQLLVDKKENLWVLLSDGRVGIFDTRRFVFKEVVTHFKGPVSPNTMLKRLITDEEGNIFYIIAGSEVITFNGKANAFSDEYNFFKQKPGWQINDFIQQPGTQKYWMSVVNGGLAIYNKSTGSLSEPGDNTEKEPAVDAFDRSKSFHSLFFDAQKRIWAVNQEQQSLISCYSTAANQFILKDISLYPQLKSYFDIKRFMQQTDGTIWLHGMLAMARFIEKENRFQLVYNGYLNEHSIAYEMVHCLYEDRDNNIWVSTDNNGLYRFNPSMEFFANIDHISRATGKKGDGNVLSFMYTKWGTLLTGTWNDGIYQYDSTFNAVPLNIKGLDDKAGPSIWCMTASKDSNTIWLGAQTGFYAVDQTHRSAKYFNPPVIGNSIVRQIVEDKNGNIWLGTQTRGLFKYSINPKNNQPVEVITAVPAAQINKITIDADGKVWAGTPENGLFVLDADTHQMIMHFGEEEQTGNKLPERGISSVLQFSDSVMLISTATRLVKYNTLTKELKQVGGANIISGFITAMEKDRNGYIWLTSTSGLYQIDIYKKIFIVYDRTDGLDNEHFVQSASYTMPDGKILFGATHNFISFSPLVKTRPYNIQVKVTDIRLQNKLLNTDSVLSLKEFALDYNDNPLVIEFSPFLFSSIGMVKYKMEGLDKDWNVADRSQQATYNYLPPGTYSFMIKPYDFMGNELKPIVPLQIKVDSPFWKTWWFYSLLVLIIGAVLYWLDQQRMKRKESIQKMRSAIADDLYQDVNTALDNINILSEMARLKADHEPEKSKEFIEQIHNKSHNMIIAMDDMLWSISPENDGMDKTVLRLKEFIDALKNRHGVQIDLLVDQNVNNLQLNMKQRKDVFWFFKGGIANVVRTGGTNCLIHITYEKPDLLYTLEFDTTHTNAQQLNNLRQRQELTDKLAAAHATLEVKEMKSKTIFVLTIPVGK